MNAIRVHEFGGPEVLRLESTPDLTPERGQVLVCIAAAGVNPVETYIRSGSYARLPKLPCTPGSDGAGTVEAVGAGVTHVSPGDRVYLAGSVSGTYAEFSLANAEQVYPLPKELSLAQGAAIGVPYATAHHALFGRGGARKGETILIHGGTGGVGIAAVQLARAAGLRVLATGGTESGRLLLREQGASEAFDHHEVGYLDAIRESTHGKGVDLILELLANVNLGHDLTMLASRGRVVIVGSRGPVEINPRDLMSRETDIRGVMLSAVSKGDLAAIHEELAVHFQNGTATPIVEREFALANAAAAHVAVMSAGAHGKIILRPDLKAADEV
jgi:NADPH2:quinone reductase